MCDLCYDNTFSLSEKERIQLSKELNIDGVVSKAIDQLFDAGTIDKKTRKQLFVSHNTPLQKAVEEGYGNSLAKIEYGTPNYEFLKQLQTNTAVFAMFKNHASMKDMAALLKDDEGNLRSKFDFKKEALKKDATYRTTKLDVEYDTAVRQARMASQWAKYQKNKRLYPNLRYLLTKAAKPDELHLKYVGIVRPVDDAFWNSHYPPNRWRCQCSVEQTDDEVSDLPGDLPAVPEEFAFNSGKTGQIFDLVNSDYIKSVPAKDQPALIREATNYFNAETAATVPYQVLYKSKKGGSVEVHPLSFNDPDFDKLVSNARSLANQGRNIKMLPDIKEPATRKALLPAELSDKIKTADFLIDDKTIADLKVMEGSTKNTLKHQFTDQANNIIIEATGAWTFTKDETVKMLSKKMAPREMKGFGEVWINYKGEWLYNPHKKKRD